MQGAELTDSAIKLPDGNIQVTANLSLPDGCWKSDGGTAGAPAGAAAIGRTLSVTLTRTHSGGQMCPQIFQDVSITVSAKPKADTQAILIYTRSVVPGKPDDIRVRALAMPR